MNKYTWYCRWCGNTYKPKQETDRDGFDKNSCKQALYRAHKKCVTVRTSSTVRVHGQGVTRITSGLRRGMIKNAC